MKTRLILPFLLLALPVAAQPQRIVSTSPSITETLFAIGAGSRVVGVSDYCRYPEAVLKLPKVGTFLRPNAEQIARLKPDLVIIHKRTTDLSSRLSALGIRSLEVERGNLPSLYTMIEKIGDATGAGPRARDLTSEIQTRLTAISNRSRNLPKGKVLFVVGRRAGTLSDIVVVGTDSYLNDLIRAAGANNALSDPSLPAYPRISLETVIRLNPDFIIDTADPMSGGGQPSRRSEIEALWKGVPQVIAVQTGHVHALSAEVFGVPGPRVAEVVDTLFKMALWQNSWVKAERSSSERLLPFAFG
jgi:iron complex transport system substrate-binding protein